MICNKNKSSCCPFTKIYNKISGGKNNVAIVNLSGVIGKMGKIEQGINIDNVNPLLEKAFETKGLKD